MYDDLRKERLAWLVLFGACLTVFFTAFEVRQPVLYLGPVNFTTSEMAAGFFIFTTAAWAMVDRSRFFSLHALDLAVLLFVISNYVSSTVAVDKSAALKFSLRMTFAALVYLGISRLPSRARSHLLVAGTATVTLLIVALLGLLQNFVRVIDWPRWLSPWQEGTITFGAFYNVRISSTLPFPTSLAMYVELTLPLLIVTGLWLTSRRSISVDKRRLLTAVTIVAIAAVAAVQIYTYTRSALVATPLSMIVGAGLALLYGYGRRVAAYFILAAVLIGAILGLTAILSNKMASRLGIAEQVTRYSAEYTIIEFPSQLKLGQEYKARLHIRNTSEVVWKAQGRGRVILSHRWFRDKQQEEVRYVRTELPADVGPGEGVDLDVGFAVPDEPGQYILSLDLIQGGVGWFATTNVRPVIVALEIDQQGSHPVSVPDEEINFIWYNEVLTTPPRSTLWRAALEMWRDHPVLGVGPDQFRVRYGEYISGVPPDDRVRTNNIFLEAASTTGVVGLAVLMFLLATAAWYQWRLVRNRKMLLGKRLVALALPAALIPYVAHGLLDNFLWQTGITFMFFSLLGLTSWLYYNQGDEASGTTGPGASGKHTARSDA